ncbi:hypothetical protein B0H17DRAFT_1126792 [Mycena rosella]|uniref:Uncharacterized protein n=1 Tax=Mycena rosella TaxID=1033263 RepID=A0AAD7GSQ3_MYCRO|nr:hypothetical protein B0H17DRAFT_1126792 [Mycena rosella]
MLHAIQQELDCHQLQLVCVKHTELLNEHQHSWILDVGIHHLNLPNLVSGKAANAVYDQVKNNAFEAKAFKHKVQPGNWVEEACLAALIVAWKQKHKKETSAAADNGDASDREADDGGCVALAIKKVISNKWPADIRKRKGPQVNTGGSTDTSPPTKKSAADAPALLKLLGLAAYTGCNRFRDDRHNVIYKLSMTLPCKNAGGKFCKAEGILWVKEDQASWEEAAVVKENIDWVQHQQLVPKGFKNMMENLHGSLKFHPFITMMVMGWLDKDRHIKFEWQVLLHLWSCYWS